MIIVSQDKEEIINLDNIQRLYIDSDYISTVIYAECIEDDIFIGTYITKERAKEVLQEIVENYRKNIIHGSSSCFSSTKVVYEMPED